jgi:putative transposase
VHRPRVRSYDGREVELPAWTAAQAEDWLGRWAMNLKLINVSTRKLKRAVRLPDGDLPAVAGDGTSKSAASRRFVALSADRLAAWMASDLSALDLLVIQIDGLHIGNDLVLLAALGIDADGGKHPLALVEGASENAGADRQPDRARARLEGLPAVHRRRRQGAEQGHSSDLRRPHADPALPDP